MASAIAIIWCRIKSLYLESESIVESPTKTKILVLFIETEAKSNLSISLLVEYTITAINYFIIFLQNIDLVNLLLLFI